VCVWYASGASAGRSAIDCTGTGNENDIDLFRMACHVPYAWVLKLFRLVKTQSNHTK